MYDVDLFEVAQDLVFFSKSPQKYANHLAENIKKHPNNNFRVDPLKEAQSEL